MNKKLSLLIILALIATILILANNKSIDDLKVIKSESKKDQKQLNFINSLGLATFEGAWVPVNIEDMVNKINSVRIDCWAESMICNVAQADIIDGYLSNKISYFEIDSWTTDGQITAKSSSACEDIIIKMDIINNTVMLTESLKENADKKICFQDPKPVILNLSSIR